MHSLKMHKPIAESTAVRSPAKLIKSSFNKSLRAPWFSILKTSSTNSRQSATTYASPTPTTAPESSPLRKGAKRRSWDGEAVKRLPKTERSRLRLWFLLAPNDCRFHRAFLDERRCHAVCRLAI